MILETNWVPAGGATAGAASAHSCSSRSRIFFTTPREVRIERSSVAGPVVSLILLGCLDDRSALAIIDLGSRARLARAPTSF